ncbi:IS3 family transposase [Lacticaseibacillus pantheris]|uniref:IS3 family transposase n=1 Tax=Lacticaseibacillus pantheris TaxID=171523 RepID=UPI00345453A4
MGRLSIAPHERYDACQTILPSLSVSSNGVPIWSVELRKTVKKYASWFNNDRISMVLNGLTPREYRQQFKLSKSV